MKRYEKPSLTVARFTTQETIANSPYSSVTVENVDTETVEGVDMVVTDFNIASLGSNS